MANKSSKRKAENDRRIRKGLTPNKHMAPKESPIKHGGTAFMHDKKQAIKKAKEAEQRAIDALFAAQQAAERKASGTSDKPKGGYKGKKSFDKSKAPRR